MSRSSSNGTLPRLAGIGLAITLACATLAILVTLNFERVDSLIGAVITWDSGSGTYLASYDDFRLTATRDEFFKFSSGRGGNLLSNSRIQFADGNVVVLPQLTPDIVKSHFPDAEETLLSDRGQNIVRFGIGFDSFDFVDSKLEGVTLSEDSNIAIDFGDGQFVKLPVDREKLLKLLGPPNDWEKRKGGPP